MNKNDTDIHVTRCLHLIEESLGWGKSADWKNYDFSKLSDEVHNRTNVRLSTTTLKRIWGRLKYESAPTLTTLNTLAQFTGSADWRSFCQQHVTVKESVLPVQPTANYRPRSKIKAMYYWLLITLSVVVVTSFLMFRTGKQKIDPDKFAFRPNKIKTEGVPNSVVFHYNAEAAQTDSVFIVQTWDMRRKKLVSKNNHDHSAIYYYPGFFNTKLIVDGEVAKSHELWITSDGWLALAEAEPTPIYFEKQEYMSDDSVVVNEALLKKYKLSLHPDAPKIRFFNQRDLGDIMSDNFTFETSLKNTYSKGMAACQFVQVLIQCKDDIIIIPLAAKPCVGDLDLWFCGTGVNSEEADLSGFGSNLSEWTRLRVETVNKHATIFVNGVKAYSLTFPNEPTGVVGVQYRFSGTGAVKDTWFEWEGKKVKL